MYDTYYSVYDADAGQAFYENQRLNCGRGPKWANTNAFIDWADDKMLNEKWSPDDVVGFARKHALFDCAIIPGTTALYQWIDRGIMRTKNMDLLEKLSRKIKAAAQDTVPTSVFSGRQLKNALKKLKPGKHSVIGQSTQSWETDQVGCRAADAG